MRRGGSRNFENKNKECGTSEKILKSSGHTPLHVFSFCPWLSAIKCMEAGYAAQC